MRGAAAEPVQIIYSDGKANVPEGRYIMRTTLQNAVVEQEVDISGTELNQPEAILDAGVLSITLLAEEGGQPVPEAVWEMNGAGGVSDVGYGQSIRVFPSGEYELAMTLGELSAKEVGRDHRRRNP